MTTPARIAHQTVGRIRLEVPSRRGDHAFFTSLADQLAQSGQVARARGNARAASVVVEYSGPLEVLLAQCKACALQLTGPALSGITATTGSAATTPPAVPIMAALAGARMNPMTMAGAAFAMIGLVQTARGEIMLPALSAFWYAASALRLARLPDNGSGALQAATQSNQTSP